MFMGNLARKNCASRSKQWEATLKSQSSIIYHSVSNCHLVVHFLDFKGDGLMCAAKLGRLECIIDSMITTMAGKSPTNTDSIFIHSLHEILNVFGVKLRTVPGWVKQ